MFHATLRTALKVGPLAIIYLILLMSTLEKSPDFYTALLVFLFGSLICMIIALFAGILVFGIVVSIHEYRPFRGAPLQIFEKLLPYFILLGVTIFGLTILADKDEFVMAFSGSIHLSIITGWYFFSMDYFKTLKNENRNQ